MSFYIRYFVCSVSSLLCSLSPLATLWHKSARLLHCLRWNQAEDMAGSNPLSPDIPHTNNTPPPHHCYLPSPTPGIPVTSPSLLRDFGDHIVYHSGAFPPATINSHEVGATPSLSTAPLSAQTIVIVTSPYYLTFSSWLLINLKYISDRVQTLSHLWCLKSPAGLIGVSPAHSINTPLPPSITVFPNL